MKKSDYKAHVRKEELRQLEKRAVWDAMEARLWGMLTNPLHPGWYENKHGN